jgi:hypothetical protein
MWFALLILTFRSSWTQMFWIVNRRAALVIQLFISQFCILPIEQHALDTNAGKQLSYAATDI